MFSTVYKLCIGCCLLPSAYCLFALAALYCLPSTVYLLYFGCSLLPSAYCLVVSAVPYCLLPSAYCLILHFRFKHFFILLQLWPDYKITIRLILIIVIIILVIVFCRIKIFNFFYNSDNRFTKSAGFI